MDKKNKRVYLSNTKEERAININQFFTLYVDFSKNNTAMKSTITTPDELTTLRIEGSSGFFAGCHSRIPSITSSAALANKYLHFDLLE